LRKNCGLVDEKVVTGIQIQHCLAKSTIIENTKITKEKKNSKIRREKRHKRALKNLDTSLCKRKCNCQEMIFYPGHID